MKPTRLMHFAAVTGALALAVIANGAAAQSQPPTIPTAVAQGLFTSMAPSIFGKLEFFSGRVPKGWPAALVPARGRIVGGSTMGDSGSFYMRVAVFALSNRDNPSEVVRTLLTQNGYVLKSPVGSTGGGFVNSDLGSSGSQYCNGSTVATFELLDSVQTPNVVAIQLLGGETGKQRCTSQPDRMRGARRFPVQVPTLSPPRGSVVVGSGRSGWSNDEGSMGTKLQTSMPADSIMFHYAAQLAAGGWTSDGKPIGNDIAAVQRFLLAAGQDPWTATLMVVVVNDRRDVSLLLTKNP